MNGQGLHLRVQVAPFAMNLLCTFDPSVESIIKYQIGYGEKKIDRLVVVPTKTPS
jgi:hypothetical protein